VRLTAEQASDHVGERAIVCDDAGVGPLVEAPGEHRLLLTLESTDIVAAPQHADKFVRFVNEYRALRLCAQGIISRRADRIQVVVTDPADLALHRWWHRGGELTLKMVLGAVGVLAVALLIVILGLQTRTRDPFFTRSRIHGRSERLRR
jgi:hypothetical protein